MNTLRYPGLNHSKGILLRCFHVTNKQIKVLQKLVSNFELHYALRY